MFISLFQNILDIHGEWLNLDEDVDITHYTQAGLTLHQGGIYSTRVGAVNKAGFVAAFETDGVIVDITPPIVSIIVWRVQNMLLNILYAHSLSFCIENQIIYCITR